MPAAVADRSRKAPGGTAASFRAPNTAKTQTVRSRMGFACRLQVADSDGICSSLKVFPKHEQMPESRVRRLRRKL